jgi:hypothetical protein
MLENIENELNVLSYAQGIHEVFIAYESCPFANRWNWKVISL